MKTLTYLSTLVFSMTFFSCENVPEIAPEQTRSAMAIMLTAATPTGYNVAKNQAYGTSPSQVYDVYTPILSPEDIVKKSVSVVMVHGGGWSLLDKSFLDRVVEDFKKQNLNLTIFNINHRLPLSDNVTFKNIMEDFNLFFEHQQSLKTSLNLADEVFLWGYSSGGHLALTYSYKYQKPYIKAVAAVAAPTDLTKTSINQGIIFQGDRNLTEILIGSTFENNPEAYKEASPIFKANRRSVRTILFYGGQDELVDDEEQGKTLYNKLTEINVEADLRVLPEATHEMTGQMDGIVNTTMKFVQNL